MNDVHVTAVVGSLRAESYTRQSCRRALSAAESYEGVETDLLDLRELDLPVFDADDRAAGDAADLRERVRAAARASASNTGRSSSRRSSRSVSTPP